MCEHINFYNILKTQFVNIFHYCEPFSCGLLRGKWKTWKAGTGTGTETEIRKRSSDLKVSIVRLDVSTE